MVNFCKSDKMRKISRKVNKPNRFSNIFYEEKG